MESAHGLPKKDREAAGRKGNIIALLYVAALLAQPGMSLGSTLGAGFGFADYVKVDVSLAISGFLGVVFRYQLGSGFRPNSILTLYISQGDFMTLEPQGNARATFSDLPVDEGLAWATKIPHHSNILSAYLFARDAAQYD